MEQFNPQPRSIEIPTSREGLVIKKLIPYLQEKGMDIETISEDDATEIIAKKFKFPGTTPEGVIAEIKNMGYLQPVPDVAAEAETEGIVFSAPSEPVIFSNYKKLQGVTEVEDPEILQVLEENKFYEELSNNIFKNDDLEAVHEIATGLEKDHPAETPEYYNQFAGLVRGGQQEIDEDMQSLALRQESFRKKMESLPEAEAKKAEKMKKIATIVECAIAYAVTTVGWYGDNASIEQTSKFDDHKRSVDGVFQIREGGDENAFLALGVDATFRGLLSKEYKDKFAGLLKNIDGGYKTKIKYFKNHQGEAMKEFAVPKIVLYFDSADVKSLVGMVKNSDDLEAVKEFKNSPQKIAVMNQILAQCDLLAEFADQCGNSISDKYIEFVEAVDRLGQKDPEIQAIIDSSHESDVSKHMRYLISEYKQGALAA
jgi:phage terminase small subunit